MNQPYNPLESPGGRPTININLQDGSNEQVAVIIIHKDRPELLNICVQSTHVMSHLNNYECIVVDNASGQETQEYLDVLQAEGIKVVRNKTNEYWSQAANLGVQAADPNSRFFVFLHADTVVLDPAWLDILVNLSISNHAGIVGTQLGHYLIQRQKVEFIQEWCMLISRDCWNDCGPWPVDLPFVGMSFIMTLRAQTRGHQPQITTNNIVHHYRAFSMDPNEYERITERSLGIIGRQMLETHRT